MKKLTVKTLSQHTFKIEIDEDKTVKDLKDKIEAEQGKDYPYKAQKLIYNGKILTDESKLSEYAIDEKKFIVLMITRPPPPPRAPSPEITKMPTTTATSSSSSSSTVKREATEAKREDPKSGSKAATPATTTTTTTSSSSTTSTQPPTVSAARTTNPTTTPAHQQQPSTRPSSGGRSDLLGDPMAHRLATMMHQPHFRQIQELIQHNPHLLSSTIEALAGSDPELYNFISENPDMFVNALGQPPAASGRAPSSRSSTTGPAGQMGGQQGSGAPPSLDQVVPNVSDHDKEAIERLKELGFPEVLVVQAYIACDKDEQLAANLLFQMD